MSYMLTYTDIRFDPLNPRPEDISIVDIAHSLSFQCRFNGHLNFFYSVAEHCIRVSQICSAQNKLWGLLHDGLEAYFGDIIRPVKDNIPACLEAEDRLLTCVAERFDLCLPMPKEVMLADNILLMTEARDLRSTPLPSDWGLPGVAKLAQKIEPMQDQNEVKQWYLDLFYQYGGKT